MSIISNKETRDFKSLATFLTHPVYLRIHEPTIKHTHEKTQEELEKEKKRATETETEKERVTRSLRCVSRVFLRQSWTGNWLVIRDEYPVPRSQLLSGLTILGNKTKWHVSISIKKRKTERESYINLMHT